LGLGMDYVRFAGNQTGTKHQGIRWGGSIGILPVDTEKGISATPYKYSSLSTYYPISNGMKA
jgi:hypothetical protein